MKPPLVVGGQNGIWASLLKAADEDLQTAHHPTNELCTSQLLQTAVMLYVVLLDQVIDAYCWVAICNVDPTACRTNYIQCYTVIYGFQ